jgi:putative NIF3 family GTP cyclohydrolase 1 type 2
VLPAPIALAAFAQKVKTSLSAPHVEIAGAPTQMVERVAIACGAAASFLPDAAARKADAFLTGEARFHDVLAAEAQRIALVLPGHYASERCGVEELAARLQMQFADLQIWASRRERNPLAAV